MTTAHKNSMRGLTVFITDVRNATSKEEEEKRVNKEQAKIRKVFKEAKDVDGYDRRKYVSKILYMYLLGYDIDFGYLEAINLLSSLKFQEKLIGYLAVSLLLHENHSMIPLLIQSLQNDLQSRNEFHQCLALISIGNIGGKEMAESVAPMVQKMLISKSTKLSTKKKAALCLLRMVRKYPELMTAEAWCDKIQTLLDENDLGLLTSIMGLLLGIVSMNPSGFEPCVKKVIWILTKILLNRDYTKDYVYYNMANPWLQVKLLRFLQFYPPCDDKTSRGKLNEILKKILSSADVSKGQSINHKNALNAVLFEAIDLLIHLDDDRELIRQAASLLGRFISAKETNMKYLALEAMEHLAALDNETAGLVKKHQETVILALKDPDISIRKRALDLLYGMCDRNNAKAIVSELLTYLATADFTMREELVIKIAILAEKFAAHYSWFVDVILQLISLAGDFVSDDIWFRVVQIVTNHEDIQEYAAKTVFEALKQPNCHETAVKVGGYILGEFGHLIAEQPRSGPNLQFEVLQSKFPTCNNNTKGLLLSTYIKFLHPYPELAESIRDIFKAYGTSIDTELQQRACEYLKLSHASEELLSVVWDVMPAFPERRENRFGLVDSSSDNREGTLNRSFTESKSSSTSNIGTNNSSNNLLDIPEEPVNSGKSNVNRDPLKDLEGLWSTASNTSSGNISTTLTNSGNNLLVNNTPLAVVSPFERPSETTVLSDQRGLISEEDISDFFKKSCLLPEGILYQDEIIRIGFKSEYSRGMGRLMLYYINLSNQPLTGFRTFVPANQSLTVNLQPIGPIIDPKSQLQQMVTVACLSPYGDPPSMELGFVYNGRLSNLKLKLPIVMARFMEPSEMNGPEFFQYWKQVAPGPPLEQQSVVKSPSAIDLVALGKSLSLTFRFSILKGVDPNINNLVAAGNFTSSSGIVFCLLRIESNPTAMMYRVTLRTPSPQLSPALKDLIVGFLQGI